MGEGFLGAEEVGIEAGDGLGEEVFSEVPGIVAVGC